jgi:undecaprenyl-diphosphatase
MDKGGMKVRKRSFEIIDNKILNLCSFKIENKCFDKIMPIITRSNDYGKVYISLAIFSIVIDYKRIEAINILIALVLGMLLGEGLLKHLIRRNRPKDRELNKDLLVKTPRTSSFPSGHTTSSFATIGVLWFMNSGFFYVFLIMAVLIAFSRIYLYLHYPSDVLAGIVLGLGCGKLVMLLSSNIHYVNIINRIISDLNYLTLLN